MSYSPAITALRVVQREYVHPDKGVQSVEYQFQFQEGDTWRPIQVIRETIVTCDTANVAMVPTKWIDEPSE